MKKRKISGFIGCLIYAAALGVLSFVIGRLVPKTWFRSDAFPFKCHEKEAKLHKLLRVKDWQSKVPDMSRIFKRIMPEKRITSDTLADLPRMLQETCVAELTHVLLCVCAIAFPFIWPGVGGIIIAAVYVLFGNLPFIIIQRYNRPRLQKLADHRSRRSGGGK